MHTHHMPSDVYLNNPDEVEEMKSYGCEVEPVDLNQGFVPTDKYEKDNAEKTEDSIRRRFSL